MSQIKHRSSAGFTLIEVLIIAPVVILAISGFVSLMIMMVGDVLVTRDQNNMSYETQDALDTIEQDTHLSTQFLVTSGNLPAPQGSDSNFTGTAPFTSSSSTLIFGGLTTNKNPADPTRELIYYDGQPNTCGAQKTYNRLFQAKIMYFLKSGSLWRRTVLPDFNTNIDNMLCATPWQRNTCSPGYSVSTRCQTNDSRLMDNVETFNVKYFNSPSSTAEIGSAQALNATTIEVTLQGKKTTAGRSITNAGSLRATKLNNIDVELPIPDSPSVYGKASGNSAVFTWEKVPLASSYVITHYVNGVGPTTTTVNAQTTSHTVNASPLATVTVSVTARNPSGTSSAGTATVTIPAPTWTDCPSSTNWTNFNLGYAGKGVLKTDTGVVYLKGLIRAGGTTAAGTTVCNLPVGFRPNADLTFITSTNGGTEGTSARLDVQTDGDVVIQAIPANTWLSLDTIRFVASTAAYTPTAISTIGASGWIYWGAPYSTLQSIVDSTGRVHLQGLLKNGNSADWTSVANLPVGQRPSHIMTFPTTSGTPFNQFSLTHTGNGVIAARGIASAGYWSIQSMHYPYTFSGWTNLPLNPVAGWVALDPNYSPPSYTKATDGVVTLRGAIKNGATAAGTVIGTLPAGHRPMERLVFTTDSAGAWSRVDIFSNGDIVLRVGSASFLSLDNISFIAEQ